MGKNGTGKSNLFEALIEIFQHLYNVDNSRDVNPFEYSLKYEIEESSIEISWKNEILKVNGKERRSIERALLPDNVIVYYSGHNTKVSNLVQEYEESFKRTIRTANIQDTRKFIGIDKEYKQLLLAILLLQKNDNKARKFICKKLGIVKVDNELKVVCRGPKVFPRAGSKVFPTHFN